MRAGLVATAVGLAILPVTLRAVSMDLVWVGEAGNAPDPRNTNSIPGIGSVGYGYAIGEYEVVNAQYVEFLNSVAAADTYGLYGANMTSVGVGGIERSGMSGSYTYSVKSGYDNMPVVYVSFYDAARFVNWLENGQPVGAQGAGTTESGTYTLFTSGATTTNISGRAPGANWAIPTENEWYKAAYHDPTGGGATNGYWLYPTRSNAIPNSRPPNATDPNSANFFREVNPLTDGTNDGYAKTSDNYYNGATNYLTDVGSYGIATSYHGTFDQGGNASEWTENPTRTVRNGNWNNTSASLRSFSYLALARGTESGGVGFRVMAMAIPEPGSGAAMVGGVVLALGIGVARWRGRAVASRPRRFIRGRGR